MLKIMKIGCAFKADAGQTQLVFININARKTCLKEGARMLNLFPFLEPKIEIWFISRFCAVLFPYTPGGF